MKANRDKKHLVDWLLARAVYWTDARKPGEVIKKMNPEQREVCKTLNAEDFRHRMGV